MAERRPTRNDGDGTVDELVKDRSDQRTDRRRLPAGKAGRAGLEQITELTGRDPESVSGVEPTDDGWLVTVEMVEDRRIPSSTDLLATYQIELDPDGELVSYGRTRRYTRGRGDSDGGT